MITIEQAKAMKPGQYLYSKGDKKPVKWKVNGQPQLGKRDQHRVRVPLKHGLRTYDQLTENYLDKVFMTEEEAK